MPLTASSELESGRNPRAGGLLPLLTMSQGCAWGLEEETLCCAAAAGQNHPSLPSLAEGGIPSA